MNNEHETSAISLHGFNEIEGRRLRGFLNVKKKENSMERKNENDCESSQMRN
jgi:hypothetical protein